MQAFRVCPVRPKVLSNVHTTTSTLFSHPLIPKPGKSTDIRNWRPISLLNCDYKILAKTITFRLLPFLENYISQTQQAAIKGRQLHNVLLNIKSAIDYVNDISHPLALLQLDFAKGFDNVSHKFILSPMRHINLPPALIQWTTILLQDISAKILVNHTLTDRIPITTGIRQGCPLSMLLFSIATDVLSKKISSSSSIKGLSLGSASIKLQQYADDTILFLTDQSEVNPALQLIQDFSSHANLRINRKKTTILSNNKHLSDEIKKHLPEAKYPNEAKILGIRFSLIFSTLKQNWSRLTGIIKGVADSHKHCNISMHGKLLLIKTLLLPHITFTAKVFQCPRNTQISVSKILHKFLWSPSYFEPISRITLSKIPQHGGIGMPSSSALTNIAFLIRFKSLTANPTPTSFGCRMRSTTSVIESVVFIRKCFLTACLTNRSLTLTGNTFFFYFVSCVFLRTNGTASLTNNSTSLFWIQNKQNYQK